MPDPASFLSYLTRQQQAAVLTVDRSLLVSAAAGAGKTSVLAERCAHLVCDADDRCRCGVDELLVVTFTEAAAAEMRARIGAAIRKRLQRRPRHEYLRRQLYQLDSASISTIHSFCRSLIQRWFPQAGVDPQARVLAADEAELLKREVLDAMFVERYAGDAPGAAAFRSLVADYGAGQDEAVAGFVLRVHRFASSLPDPRAWLARAAAQVDPQSPDGLPARMDELQRSRLERELTLQIDHARELAAAIRRGWPVAQVRADYLDRHGAQLAAWRDSLVAGPPAAWEDVAGAVRGFEPPAPPRKPPRLDDADSLAWENAKKLVDEARSLLDDRLRRAVCAFTGQEYRQGLARIAPHVAALAGLAAEFDRLYGEAKRALAAVDFDDLQRLAYQLLTTEGDPARPSEVARQLHARYRYVLVDEFQDIDPLQAAILFCVSREAADPPGGNLFAVGDIKQSIYRFRLAEPDLFAERQRRFDRGSPIGQVIRLRENFRSRTEIIAAVNAVFRPLMRDSFGGTDYDERAELHAAAAYPASADGPMFGLPALELHLLEPITAATARGAGEDETDERPDTDAAEELEGIEREAFLVGQRIRQWLGLEPGSRRMHVADRPPTPGGPPASRPLRCGDIVILLRSLPHKADPIAEVLRRMEIPVRVERDAASIDSTEFRDLISLLAVLDNARQDIPLAAVLRSVLIREPLSESDLMRIRLIDREVPFHEAVERYAQQGPQPRLRARLTAALAWMDRWRQRLREAPLAEVLWQILQDTDYLAFVAGLPGGRRRREHLLRLHELARQFGHFSRQGLHRFLRFIDELARSELQPQQPAAGSAENAVRIMTIHGSKGLEFPVVILADAHKRFNLEDARAPVLVDRRLGIGMRAVDADRCVRYPTLAHQLAAGHMRLDTLAEELRIWYVALTRAREHLMLIGRISPAEVRTLRDRYAGRGGQDRLTQLALENASRPLDWLLPAVFMAPPDQIAWADRDAEAPANPLFSVTTYSREATEKWQIPPTVDTGRAEVLARLADLEPLPAGEPVADDETIEPHLAALASVYPGLELTTLPARTGATELKRRWDAMADPDERRTRQPAAPALPGRPLFLAAGPVETPADRGIATHRFLQWVDLSRPCDAADLDRQRDDLVRRGRLSSQEADRVMIDGAAWFLASALGERLRAAPDRVRREVAFVSRLAPDRLDPQVHPRDERDVVLVRGIADVVLSRGDGLEIIDYKTDDVPAGACRRRAEEYRGQIDMYAEALAGIWRLPAAVRYLVFLCPRQVVELRADGG